MTLKARLLWFVGLFVLVISVSVACGFIFGKQAAVYVLSLGGALAALLAGFSRLIEGHFESRDPTSHSRLSPRRVAQIMVIVSFVVGAAGGYGVPQITQILLPESPTVRVYAPVTVEKNDRVQVQWKQIPQGQEIWLLVHHRTEPTYYPQRCHFAPQFDGRTECPVEVGRSDQAGETFEVIPLLAATEACRELEAHVLDGTDHLPPSLILFPATRTTRRAN